MVCLLGEARTLGAAWLGFLLMRVMPQPASAVTEGEVCRSWSPWIPDEEFLCPDGDSNAEDAKFCCGNCSAPYCCSSEGSRLDQAQCPANRPETGVTADPRPGTTPARDLPYWELVVFVLVAMLLCFVIGCGLSWAVNSARRQFCRWWASRNLNRYNFPQPSLRDPSLFGPPSISDCPTSCDEDRPHYSMEDPPCPRVLPPTFKAPPTEQLSFANVVYQEPKTQPRPALPSEPALTARGPPPSRGGVSSWGPSPSDAGEPHGARPGPSTLAGRGPQRCNTASALDYDDYDDDESPYSLPYDALPTLGPNPQAQGKRVWLVVPSDAPLRPSALASLLSSEDASSNCVAVSQGLEVLPSALSTPPIVQFWAAPGDKDEMATVSPQGLQGTSSVFEPVMKGSKLNLPVSRI